MENFSIWSVWGALKSLSWMDRKTLISGKLPGFRFHEYHYPILCPDESIPLMVGTRIGPFVGKVRVRNNKPDQARDGAIVSLGIHASW